MHNCNKISLIANLALNAKGKNQEKIWNPIHSFTNIAPSITVSLKAFVITLLIEVLQKNPARATRDSNKKENRPGWKRETQNPSCAFWQYLEGRRGGIVVE
jgi:hypothetical protein